ncbi:MAG: glycosyltransferase family protein [Myxococcales bacterium]|nr:glycosyltransferase family protein [Myxococcales bacterium]
MKTEEVRAARRVVASIEARMGSSRLPGKVLADVGGVTAIGRLVRRLRRAKRLDGIVLATTVSPADDALAAWAEREGVAVFRGSEEDVLLRVVEAQRSQRSDVVVEVTGDCTLLDPEIIDLGVETYFENECDVACNVRKPSYPMGADVQVFSLAMLEDVERTITDPAVREHVSLYFYEHPERYRVLHMFAPPRWRDPTMRLQLDYEEDLRFIREVYARLEPAHGDAFGLEEIFALCREHPELPEINRHCEEKAPR